MAEHNLFGRDGEDAAVEYLLRSGYAVVDRNWRSGHKEIDIVAEKDGVLLVVEVKTRGSSDYGSPEDAVSAEKMRRTQRAADAYVRYHRLDMPVRFDIISVLGKDRKIHHIEDAFRMTPRYR